jgi:CubicO group peptidase (beta-lactamase class C family)
MKQPKKNLTRSKFWTRLLILFVALSGILAAIYLVLVNRTDTFTGRWVAWKSSDVDDIQRFPYRAINTAPPAYHFKSSDMAISFENIDYQHNGVPRSASLESILETTGTIAFIVIKDDTLLYEGYLQGYQRDSLVTSFSIAKSITSLMVGMAIDDGYIESLNDPVTRYIPELLATDPGYQNITLEHLLSMKSGITFKDTDIPWHDKSKAYYHPNLREVVLHLPLAEAPGETFVYNTFNPIILGIVLERATGQTVAQYFESRFWQRSGMEYDASWSIDSEADGMAKMESGLNARAIDFAKIGGLFLNKGDWNGEQIIPSSWITASGKIDPANHVARLGENTFYQYGWWVYSPSRSGKYCVFGSGHLGQYLFVFPDDGMIVLRFGKEIGKVDSWYQIAQEIVNISLSATVNP